MHDPTKSKPSRHPTGDTTPGASRLASINRHIEHAARHGGLAGLAERAPHAQVSEELSP